MLGKGMNSSGLRTMTRRFRFEKLCHSTSMIVQKKSEKSNSSYKLSKHKYLFYFPNTQDTRIQRSKRVCKVVSEPDSVQYREQNSGDSQNRRMYGSRARIRCQRDHLTCSCHVNDWCCQRSSCCLKNQG